MEIALRIHEADADERHAEVAGLFAVIAGEHAQPAGINRQRLMQRELRGKIGDGLVQQFGMRRPIQVLRAARASPAPPRPSSYRLSQIGIAGGIR